eukprot:1923340-Lingulodinium_polyedra.AAC.1
MEPELVAELTVAWAVTLATTEFPDGLLESPEWASTMATCVPAGGDGFHYIRQALTQEGEQEEATM